MTMDVDLYLTTQYIVATSDDLNHLEDQLGKIIKGGIENPLFEILCSIIAYLPVTTIDVSFVKFIQTLFEQADFKDENDFKSGIDAVSIFESDDLPSILKITLQLDHEKKNQFYKECQEEINNVAFNYGFNANSNNYNKGQLFTNFFKCKLIQINQSLQGYKLCNELVKKLIQSPFCTIELNEWIKKYFTPLSNLSGMGYEISLLDYQIIIPINDQINQLFTIFLSENNNSLIMNECIIPYFEYYQNNHELWNSVVDWFVRIADGDKMIEGFKKVLCFCREEKFLLLMKSQDDVIKKFINLIITMILSCSDSNLEMFIITKEMLTLIKPFTVNETEIEIDGKLQQESNLLKFSNGDFKQTFNQLNLNSSVKNKTIDYLLDIIKSGQLLNSNKLTFISLLKLKDSTHEIQLNEFVKFIKSELELPKKNKKDWKISFDSIKRINEKIFLKIANKESCELIIEKLLLLKSWDAIKLFISEDDYDYNYNYLNNEETFNLIIKFGWIYYENAQSCHESCSGLKSFGKCIELASTIPFSTVKHLEILLNATNLLSYWKIYFEVGKPVVPLDLMKIDDPFKIIVRILELNDDAYKFDLELFKLCSGFIIGFGLEEKHSIFSFADFSNNFESTNLLLIKCKILCLEYATVASDTNFATKMAMSILDIGIKDNHSIVGLHQLLMENWALFFTLAKRETGQELRVDIEEKLKMLGKLLLFTPTEFNTQVLGFWQLLNSQMEDMLEESSDEDAARKDKGRFVGNLGDINTRLQRSLDAGVGVGVGGDAAALESGRGSANIDVDDIGRNIIGWIVGAESH
ncbi:hypothetical protein DAMA08_019080 [Martiniozyma asiatica (nom. inval.)]|nr:hypothetical protein DAMA08_019080 [Martiniozyma asiatica]